MASAFFISRTFRFDASTRELSRIEPDGSATPVPLGSRAADMLLLFLQRPAELVSKNEIMDAVWPDVTVEESNLPVQIAALRRVLGASAISTIPGRGYRFTLPVQEESAAQSSSAPAPADNLNVDGAILATSGPLSAPAGASAGQANSRASSRDRLRFDQVPKWMAIGAGAAAAVVAAAVLALHWGGFFPGHRDAQAVVPDTASAHFNHGLTAIAKDDFDRAIADFTEAIRLDPGFALAYVRRGAVRRYKDDYDGAIADASRAIEVSPVEHRAYLERGHDYLAKRDLGRAIADYDAAIRLAPKSQESYFGRGLAYFYRGNLAQAQADFRYALKINPRYFAPALWLGVAQRRGGPSGEFEQAARQLDMSMWPTPIVRMLLGELTPGQALAAADDKDPLTRQRQVCQANFYGGELVLSQGAREEAARLFRLAAGNCPSSYVERQTAATELKALGNAP